MSMEKKTKAKSKSKTSDGRKQLTSVRVVQRNLVYIMGLPLDLADEDVCTSVFLPAPILTVAFLSISKYIFRHLIFVPFFFSFYKERSTLLSMGRY